jgi:hypothetical protein
MVYFKGNRHHALDLNWWKGKINSYNVNEGSFVLVYLGVLRDYAYECVKQIRLWNPTSNVYLCINNNEQNKPFLELIKEFNVDVVYVEDLQMTEDHKTFIQRYTNMSINGLWRYSMERFFILEETMKKYNLRNVFHLEIDNLIYFKVDELLEKCKSIDKILITSDSERRYIAGTCFVNNPDTLSKLNKFFTEKCINKDEMHSIFDFARNNKEVDCWPVLPYGDNTRIIYEDRRHLVNDIQRISKNFDSFKSVGDAACIGQYFFGIDKFIHNPNNTDGFINKDTIFSVDRLWFKWEKVNGLQRLNMSVDKDNWYPVTNIHVHNKTLSRGMSDISEMTKHLPNIV